MAKHQAHNFNSTTEQDAAEGNNKSEYELSPGVSRKYGLSLINIWRPAF